MDLTPSLYFSAFIVSLSILPSLFIVLKYLESFGPRNWYLILFDFQFWWVNVEGAFMCVCVCLTFFLVFLYFILLLTNYVYHLNYLDTKFNSSNLIIICIPIIFNNPIKAHVSNKRHTPLIKIRLTQIEDNVFLMKKTVLIGFLRWVFYTFSLIFLACTHICCLV